MAIGRHDTHHCVMKFSPIVSTSAVELSTVLLVTDTEMPSEAEGSSTGAMTGSLRSDRTPCTWERSVEGQKHAPLYCAGQEHQPVQGGCNVQWVRLGFEGGSLKTLPFSCQTRTVPHSTSKKSGLIDQCHLDSGSTFIGERQHNSRLHHFWLMLCSVSTDLVSCLNSIFKIYNSTHLIDIVRSRKNLCASV